MTRMGQVALQHGRGSSGLRLARHTFAAVIGQCCAGDFRLGSRYVEFMSVSVSFRGIGAAFLAAMVLGLGGCASDKPLGEQLQLTTRTVEPKPWVAVQRPQGLEYIPVGVTPGARPSEAKSPRELASATAELDGLRNSSSGYAKRAAPRSRLDQRNALAEQRRRLAAAGLLGKAKLPDEDELGRAAAKSRAFATRPLPGEAAATGEQPTSWPVPKNRRIKRGNVTDCATDPSADGCKEPGT
jgi:hypothetical protein